jgi:hypothetical protein
MEVNVMTIQSRNPSEEYKQNWERIFRKPVNTEQQMKKMNIYLAGPMRGYKDFNFPAFFEAAEKLRGLGHNVFNPAERDTKEFGAEKMKSENGSEADLSKNLGMAGLSLTRHVFLHDTHYICTTADAIALMPGWEKSKGALAEKALSEAIGLEVIYL